MASFTETSIAVQKLHSHQITDYLRYVCSNYITLLLFNEDIQTSLDRNLEQRSHIHFYMHIFFHIYTLITWQLSVNVNIALK